MEECDEERKKTRAVLSTKITNLLLTLKFVFLAEHLAGIYRFSFKDGKTIPTNFIKKLYVVCLIISYVSLYLGSLLPTLINGSSSLVEAIYEVPVIFVLIQYVMALITTNFYLSKAHEEFFSAFADLDSKLILSSNECYQKATAKNNNFLFFLVVFHIVISITDFMTADEVIDMSWIISVPLYFILELEIIVFCLAIEMLKSRLDIINGYIAKFLDDQNSDKKTVFTVCEKKVFDKETFNMIGRPSNNNMKIRDLAMMYDTIGTICALVNDIFNFQIFMTLVSAFVYIVITIWTSLYYYRTPENISGPLITIIIWCLTMLMIVALMCFVCERLRTSRVNTKVLVNQIIMDYSLPKTMRVQAKAFMELIEAWPLSILIYDMFSVDITLMLKFISVSTTYLIVIIQVSHVA